VAWSCPHRRDRAAERGGGAALAAASAISDVARFAIRGRAGSSGQRDTPHRIKSLEAIYDHAHRFPGVPHWNGAEILDWYLGATKGANTHATV
jgi:hypothetical protein